LDVKFFFGFTPTIEWELFSRKDGTIEVHSWVQEQVMGRRAESRGNFSQGVNRRVTPFVPDEGVPTDE
jgi:hypothetical protein